MLQRKMMTACCRRRFERGCGLSGGPNDCGLHAGELRNGRLLLLIGPLISAD